MTSLYNWLIRLNAVCMPLRYLWVFFAYMMLKKHADQYVSAYHFVKSRGLGMLAGFWCFAFTAFACIMGMFPVGAKRYGHLVFPVCHEYPDPAGTDRHRIHPAGTGKEGKSVIL